MPFAHAVTLAQEGVKAGSWDAKREGQLTSELEIWGQQRPELWEPPPSGVAVNKVPSGHPTLDGN